MANTRSNLPNPFRIHGVVSGDAFADRQDELARIASALTEAGGKLLVHGRRRMGKTSTILRAMEGVTEAGGHALYVDFSTASSMADLCNRILAAAGATLGRSLRDFITDIVSRVKVSITLTPDPASGLLLPGLDMQARGWDPDRQRDTLVDVLDALNAMARVRRITIGIALDEFQDIAELGGDTAEWQLRGAMQKHHALAYVLAGSREHLIARMTGKNGAFYKLVDRMPFGAIDPPVFARWIDERLRAAGYATDAAGTAITAAAGPCTRDIMQLARTMFDRARPSRRLSAADVDAALDEIVEAEHDLHLALWQRCSTLQQNVLRAVVAADGSLTSGEVIRTFTLRSSGAASKTATTLVEQGVLVRNDPYSGQRLDTPTRHAFDSPFFRRWVLVHAMADLGPAATLHLRSRTQP